MLGKLLTIIGLTITSSLPLIKPVQGQIIYGNSTYIRSPQIRNDYHYLRPRINHRLNKYYLIDRYRNNNYQPNFGLTIILNPSPYYRDQYDRSYYGNCSTTIIGSPIPSPYPVDSITGRPCR